MQVTGSLETAAASDLLGTHVQRRPGRGLLRFVRHYPLGAFGAVLIAALIFVAIFAPLLAPYDAQKGDFLLPTAPPGAAHRLGTDQYGRDVLSRIIYGSRISLEVGIIAVAIAATAGTAIGLISGYAGGWTDSIIQRLLEIVQAFPGLILALTLVAALGPAIRNVMIAVGVAAAPSMSRVVRSSVLGVKHQTYIEAARATGATGPRIMLRHILPNIVAPIIVLATAGLGAAILVEASLSFLGLGAPPPTPSWGAMLNDSRLAIGQAWWGAVYPGIAISLAVFGFNLLGDALRDVFDPRLRGSR